MSHRLAILSLAVVTEKRVPGSTADPEVAAQIAARTQASAQISPRCH